jgi:hypothetical protein
MATCCHSRTRPGPQRGTGGISSASAGTGRGIKWLTLRQRGKTELARLAALPASEWKGAVIARSGRYRRPRMHQDMVKLTGISAQARQIAIKNIGRDQPTLLITNDTATKTKDLFARYAERMMVENELDAYIGGFHLDALTSGVSLNVDLDATLTVLSGLGLLRTIPSAAYYPRSRVTAVTDAAAAACPGRNGHVCQG